MKQFIASILLCGILAACSQSEKKLHLYTWANYIKPQLIEKFEKENHCKVIVNTFDSNETMFAKLSLGATGYDILFPSNYFAELMISKGMLEPLDPVKMPNIGNVDSTYVKLLDPQITSYAIPFTVTSTAIGYRKDKIEVSEPSWGMFNRSSLKGRMTMLNDPREALGAALKFLGYSINTIEKSEIDKAKETLIKWKHNLAKFESEQYKNGLASGEYLVSQGFAGEILLVQKENPNVVCALPREGTILSIDMITLAKDSECKELSYKFVNMLLEAESAVETTLYTQFLVANHAGYKLLPEEIKSNTVIFPTKEISSKSELIKNLGANTELYNKAWDSVKAAE